MTEKGQLPQMIGLKALRSEPVILILSGPSGVGKDAVVTHLRQRGTQCRVIVTVTTRSRRPNEREGVDYLFVSEEQFQAMLGRDELLEYAQVYGRWYGVPRGSVNLALESGTDILIKTDVQGAASLKRHMPNSTVVFLVPPTLEKLEERLRHRKSDSPEQLTIRLQTAKLELQQLPKFDYAVMNDEGQLDKTVAAIESIICAERWRIQK